MREVLKCVVCANEWVLTEANQGCTYCHIATLEAQLAEVAELPTASGKLKSTKMAGHYRGKVAGWNELHAKITAILAKSSK